MPSFSSFPASVVLLLLGVSSCERRHVSVPVTAPPAASQPASRTVTPASPAPPPPPAAQSAGSQTLATETPAPEPTIAVPSSPAATSEGQPASRYQLNKPSPAAKKAVTAKKPAPGSSTAAPAPAPVATDPPAPAPKLGDVLTEQERKQYDTSIDRSLGRAQASLDQIKDHRLTAAQADEVEQIKNFMQQARGARGSDLGGAKSLAERAEVLAKDLAADIH